MSKKVYEYQFIALDGTAQTIVGEGFAFPVEVNGKTDYKIIQTLRLLDQYDVDEQGNKIIEAQVVTLE